jgi:hypothetical protein
LIHLTPHAADAGVGKTRLIIMRAWTGSYRDALILKFISVLLVPIAFGACSPVYHTETDDLVQQQDISIIQKEAQEKAMAWLLAHFKKEDGRTPRSHHVEAVWEFLQPVVFCKDGQYLPAYRLDGKVMHWPSFTYKKPMHYYFIFIDGEIVEMGGGPKPPKHTLL